MERFLTIIPNSFFGNNKYFCGTGFCVQNKAVIIMIRIDVDFWKEM